MISKGEQFPSFAVENQDGNFISNETIKGRKTILYFYSRDNTPTCTTEACEFRDHIEDFNQLDVDIYGISADSKKKHQNFIKKHQLNFDLLVDKDYLLANKVGVYQLKKSFGKENMGIVRTTFILDENGNIIDVIENVKVKTQIETIKNILEG